MQDYIFKTYIADGKEHYVTTDSQGRIVETRTVPFPESLVSLLYKRIPEWRDWFRGISAMIDLITPSDAHETMKEVSEQYDYLAKGLAYFELSKFQWRKRIRQTRRATGIITGAVLQDESLSTLCDQLLSVQQKLQTLIPHVLDMDSSKDSSPERMVSYYRTLGAESPDVYRFSSCTTNFELVDENTFAEVLYPETIFDIIDFHVRECVRREIRFRVCKNCGRYFAVTGHAGVEYCDRVINQKGQTCKEIGAFRVWEKSRSGDAVFRLYRREYKRRFAWIKAGRIEPDAFYAWSERAREKKAECEAGKMSFEDFSDWLSNS
jgi:hypothetical protein